MTKNASNAAAFFTSPSINCHPESRSRGIEGIRWRYLKASETCMAMEGGALRRQKIDQGSQELAPPTL